MKNIELLDKIDKAVQDKWRDTVVNKLPFMREHKFYAEEHALQYRKEALEEVQSIIWELQMELKNKKD